MQKGLWFFAFDDCNIGENNKHNNELVSIMSLFQQSFISLDDIVMVLNYKQNANDILKSSLMHGNCQCHFEFFTL